MPPRRSNVRTWMLEDTDLERKFNGCQRRYFMSMSKAMAAECSGEIFLLTTTDLEKKVDVPEDGIWLGVEFPSLIDPSRAEDKKVTKVSNPPSWKLPRQRTLTTLVDHIHPSPRSYPGAVQSIARLTRRRESTP
jgi:hypothetical protein